MGKQTTSEVVLIVDDVPENLAVLHDALDESGFMVLVAESGARAIQIARQAKPQIILLDALMPEMDGFEVCRQLRADFITQTIPVVFMTGLCEAVHVVAAFEAGGTDYVTKPIRPSEVLARINAHLQRARATSQARNALDAFGQATIAVNIETSVLLWQTPLARDLLQQFFSDAHTHLPVPLTNWLRQSVAQYQPGQLFANFTTAHNNKRLIVNIAAQTDELEWLLVLREESDAAQLDSLISSFKLTQREAEVLYWVIKGKTSRDIGEILGSSPRTVDKHLEHVFEKLGVETRTAAAAKALACMQS